MSSKEKFRRAFSLLPYMFNGLYEYVSTHDDMMVELGASIEAIAVFLTAIREGISYLFAMNPSESMAVLTEIDELMKRLDRAKNLLQKMKRIDDELTQTSREVLDRTNKLIERIIEMLTE